MATTHWAGNTATIVYAAGDRVLYQSYAYPDLAPYERIFVAYNYNYSPPAVHMRASDGSIDRPEPASSIVGLAAS